jgi:hypothetical protein
VELTARLFRLGQVAAGCCLCAGAVWAAPAAAVSAVTVRPPELAAAVTAATAAATLPTAPAPAQVADTAFRHDRHATLRCLDCHDMRVGHGALLVRSVADCRGCHHVPERVGMGRDCAACHQVQELRNVVYPQERVVTLSVRDAPDDRELRFSHAAHDERPCVACHMDGPSLAVPSLDCQGCHEEHHSPSNPGCMGCHREPPEDAHTLQVHATCSGSGCHADPPFQAPPRTRVGCIWCHEDKVDHEPQGRCVDCHFVSRGWVPYLSVRSGAR